MSDLSRAEYYEYFVAETHEHAELWKTSEIKHNLKLNA